MSSRRNFAGSFTCRRSARLLLVLGALAPVLSYAGAGDPDLAFGTNGTSTFNLSDVSSEWISGSYHTAVQPDGKILVAADRNVVVRLEADGSPDTSFGDRGQIEVPFSSGSVVIGLGLQSDGRFIVALTTTTEEGGSDFAFVRLTPDGSPDTSYGTDGKLIVDLDGGSLDQLRAFALLEDGRAIAAGTSYSYNDHSYRIVLVRITQNGAVDHSFGTAGLATLESYYPPILNGLEVQDDGKLLVSGAFDPIPAWGAVLTRFSSEGELDIDFGESGFVFDARVYELGATKTQPDGRIVALDSDWRDSIFRYMPDGQIDTTFGGPYNAIVDSSTLDMLGSTGVEMSDVEILSDGKILVGGTAYFYNDELYFSSSQFAAVRLDSDGVIDPTFGLIGVATAEFQLDPLTDRPVASEGRDLVLLPDDYAVLVGNVDYALEPSNVPSRTIGLVEFDPLGSKVAGFGEGGQAAAHIVRDTSEEARSVTAVQGDGKIVTAGVIRTVYGWDFLVTRHHPDGSLDTSFGGTGWKTTDIRSERRVVEGPYYTSIETQISDDRPVAVLVQPDGKIVVGGSSSQEVGNYPVGFDNRFVIVRYNPDGSFDTGFGNGGILLHDAIGTGVSGSVSSNFMGDMALQDDGKIVITGRAWIDQTPRAPGYEFVTIRYDEDGVIDAGFGQNGVVITNGSDAKRNDFPQSLVIQPDGKILVGGWFEGYLGRPFRSIALIRYLADGSLDSDFGTNGKVWVSTQDDPNMGIAYPDWGLKEIGLQSDQKIVVGSELCEFYFLGSKSGCRLSLARFDETGVRDTAFGGQGFAIFGLYPNSQEILESIAIQSDDRVLAVGESLYFVRGVGDSGTWGRPPASKYYRRQDMIVARFLADGRLDYTFGDRGLAITDFSDTEDLGQAIAIQPDGKILGAGAAASPNGDTEWDLALARYEGINTRVDELEGLVSELQELALYEILSDGEAKSLSKQLEAAIFQIDSGNVRSAKAQLEAFLDSLDSLVRTGKLPQSQANYFGDVVATVIATLA